jgi:hypothetical protein
MKWISSWEPVVGKSMKPRRRAKGRSRRIEGWEWA